MENILGALGTRFNSEKITQHNYHIFFHDVLNNMRDKPMNMLEVGVQNFNSIDMWKVYFPLAKIYAIDNHKEYKDDRICIVRADRGSRDQLNAAIGQMKTRFDFINDDGCNNPELAFDIFFTEVLNYGGVYIINGFVEEFKQVADHINGKTDTLGFLSPATLDAISTITFGSRCVIIKKKLPVEFMRRFKKKDLC